MKKFKTALLVFPEYYLMILILLSGYTPPFSVNGMAIVLMLLCLVQVIYKNRVAGMAMAGIFMLITLYMFGALMSEFFEFPDGTSPMMPLLVVGIPVMLINLTACGVMFFKYSRSGRADAQTEVLA